MMREPFPPGWGRVRHLLPPLVRCGSGEAESSVASLGVRLGHGEAEASIVSLGGDRPGPPSDEWLDEAEASVTPLG